MNNSINLLDYRSKINTSGQSKKQKPLRIVAISLLFIVATSSVVFFILIALSPLPELKNQYKKAAFTLSLSNDHVIKHEVVKERVSSIKEIMNKRTDFGKVLDYIQGKLVSGVAIDAVTMDKDSLSITISSKSLLLLDKFLNELTNEESQNKFSKVSLKNLTNTDSKSAFLLTLTINTL